MIPYVPRALLICAITVLVSCADDRTQVDASESTDGAAQRHDNQTADAHSPETVVGISNHQVAGQVDRSRDVVDAVQRANKKNPYVGPGSHLVLPRQKANSRLIEQWASR